MPSARTISQNAVLRNLPSVDELLRSDIGREITISAGDRHAAELARETIANLRQEIIARTAENDTKESLLANAASSLRNAWRIEQMTGTRRVINATGVVIHTNLGRAPLSEHARKAVADEAALYCTLEYDLETGKRGKRGLRAENLLAELTGAESVLIVNNCAAAAFFVLSAFAAGGEVIISRGEMVEIGGDFRVPDVLSQSGGTLREVGTTNRTRLTDFEKAVNRRTRVILRVHPSNYRIVGFTAMPGLPELAVLAQKHKILLYEDIGSGALIDLAEFGLKDEPVVSRSIADGADVVTFSGDKLLGGPQSGIIAGRKAGIEKLRKHPLYRALRADKLTYAALEATLESFARGRATSEIPVLEMLSMSKERLEQRAEVFVKAFRKKLGRSNKIRIATMPGVSAVGGGAAPAVQPETSLIVVSHTDKSAQEIEKALRLGITPVVARIINDKIVVDLRTVAASEEDELVASLISAVTS